MDKKIANMDYEFTPDVPISVPAERIAYTLCAALGGGSTYWCQRLDIPDYRGCGWAHEALTYGVECTVHIHQDESVLIPDTAKAIVRALREMHKHYPRHYSDMVNENEDADTGDVLLQLMVFNEVIYG